MMAFFQALLLVMGLFIAAVELEVGIQYNTRGKLTDANTVNSLLSDRGVDIH